MIAGNPLRVEEEDPFQLSPRQHCKPAKRITKVKMAPPHFRWALFLTTLAASSSIFIEGKHNHIDPLDLHVRS